MNSKNIVYCIPPLPLLMGLTQLFSGVFIIVFIGIGIFVGVKHLRGIVRNDWTMKEKFGLGEIYLVNLLLFFLLALSPIFSETMYAFVLLIPAVLFSLLLLVLKKTRPVSFFHFIIPSFIILLSISILVLKIFELNIGGGEIKGKSDTVLRNTIGVGGCGESSKSFPFNII